MFTYAYDHNIRNRILLFLYIYRVDGGVAGNDFIVQLMSDLVNQTIDRSDDGDMSPLGAAYLAGLAAGK